MYVHPAAGPVNSTYCPAPAGQASCRTTRPGIVSKQRAVASPSCIRARRSSRRPRTESCVPSVMLTTRDWSLGRCDSSTSNSSTRRSMRSELSARPGVVSCQPSYGANVSCRPSDMSSCVRAPIRTPGASSASSVRARVFIVCRSLHAADSSASEAIARRIMEVSLCWLTVEFCSRRSHISAVNRAMRKDHAVTQRTSPSSTAATRVWRRCAPSYLQTVARSRSRTNRFVLGVRKSDTVQYCCAFCLSLRRPCSQSTLSEECCGAAEHTKSNSDWWFAPAIILLLLGTALDGERTARLGDTLQVLGLAWGAYWLAALAANCRPAPAGLQISRRVRTLSQAPPEDSESSPRK